MKSDSLKHLRSQIDKTDKKLLTLLLKRRRTVEKIQKVKRDLKLSLKDSTRERQILRELTKDLSTTDQRLVTSVFKSIFEFNRGRSLRPRYPRKS